MEGVPRILMRAVDLKSGHHLLEGRSTRDRSMYKMGGWSGGGVRADCRAGREGGRPAPPLFCDPRKAEESWRP
jgi:hypothetical protein